MACFVTDCSNGLERKTLVKRIDIESILRAKHEYNKTRPYRHGGKLL